ncbi:hypothetical protein Taro_005626 [Colocasia esculenta]|uniref:Uncharacterized protein n=1 Tax=Colocasia esculenta TaxID=4460 RepID=A0A843TSZ7_COLES|nr:hypothetical protein [Colocasia esculenta]
MAPKQAPRRGARSRAIARPIPAEDAPPTERRTKRRHDPAEQLGPSSASPPSAKRVQEDQPPAQEDQPPANEGQLPVNEDQPHVENEVDVPLNAPLSPQLQPSSSLNHEMEIPFFTPQPQAQTSYAFGGPSVPPELYSFLNEKFDAFNTFIQQMTENFELKIQRLENTMSAKFIEQKAASDQSKDASIELKEHQEKLERVLQGIFANSQADVFNTKETLAQISKTILSFAHLVDDLESMKNLSAHIDEEMSDLKKEFKSLHRHGGTTGSSSSLQPISADFSGSVDTPHTGVDTMLQALSQKMKKWSTSVDTSPSQVDTRDSSQRNMSTGFYIRSTPDAVDTRCLSQGTVLPSLGQCVDTPYGQVDTLRKLCDLKLFLDT